MDGYYPKCFGTKEQFEEWVSFADTLDDGIDARSSFCSYCTKDFQDFKKETNMCDFPTFPAGEDDEDGD